jgi:hypothetical protein
MIHEDLPHHLRRQSKEMNSALPVGRLAVHQAKISFMNQSGCLQGMITALSGKILLRNSPKFVVDKRNE